MNSETIEMKALRQWNEFPVLSKGFQGAYDYYEYLKCPFDALVTEYMEENKCGYVKALRATASAYPEKHRQWILVINSVERKGDKNGN